MLLCACQSAVLPEQIKIERPPTPEIAPSPASPPAAITYGTLIENGKRRQVDLATFDFTGNATLLGPDGLRQEGQWLNGKLHGYGEASAEDHAYQGNWQHGQRHGEGSELTPDGFSYQGAWHENLKQGYGKMTYPNQVTYEGMWHANHKHGFGMEQRPDLSFYKGNWQTGKQHGEGTTQFTDGNRLSGTWHQGEIEGIATLTRTDGVVIQGEVIDNQILNGTLSLPDGNTFAGEIYQTHRGGFSPAALTWLEETAHANSAMAQYLVAKSHLDGQVDKPDPRAAVSWLERAAAQGLAVAQYELARILIDVDWGRAELLLTNAAEQGHAGAHGMLAEYYHQGFHIPQDLARAVSHYQAAVEGGNLDALNNYAWLLATTPTSYQDPQAATQLIQPLVLYLNRWQLLDTFAAAQARLGHFELAVSLQTQVVKDARLAGAASEVVFELENRLTLYRLNQPYLDAP